MSFAIRTGERVALLGPNGAGKTTLVRSICGRVRLDAGDVKIQGVSIADANARKRLGVVPQDLAIYPDLSAQDNLECFGRLHGLRGATLTSRIQWALDWIGLSERAHDLTKDFSGGMKRRVNIACGVLHRPRILLLDEPTSNLDEQGVAWYQELINNLGRDRLLVVCSNQPHEYTFCKNHLRITEFKQSGNPGIVQME